jgi:hypothetical protein
VSVEDDERSGSVQEIIFSALMNITPDMRHYMLVTDEYHFSI